MNTLTDKVLPAYEKVIYIAYGCGCVRSFHVEQPITIDAESNPTTCHIHGDQKVSSTEELVPKVA